MPGGFINNKCVIFCMKFKLLFGFLIIGLVLTIGCLNNKVTFEGTGKIGYMKELNCKPAAFGPTFWPESGPIWIQNPAGGSDPVPYFEKWGIKDNHLALCSKDPNSENYPIYPKENLNTGDLVKVKGEVVKTTDGKGYLLVETIEKVQ